METAIITILNKKGLHARAAAKFVKVVAGHDASASVALVPEPGEAAEPPVSGSSILGLMMLGADQGSQLAITAEGEQAQQLLEALSALIGNKFGEGE